MPPPPPGSKDATALADAVLGVAATLPTPGAFRSKFADLLQVYLDESAYVAMWLEDELVLATVPAWELEAILQQRGPWKAPAPDDANALRLEGAPGLALVALQLKDGQRLEHHVKALFEEMAAQDPANREIYSSALKLLCDPRGANPLLLNVLENVPVTLTRTEVNQMLEPFVGRLTAALEAVPVRGSPLLRIWKPAPPYTDAAANLFALIRFVPKGNYRRDVAGQPHAFYYSAQILAFPWLDGLFDGLAVRDWHEVLERPLGSNARFIADTPFASGSLHLASRGDRLEGQSLLRRDDPGTAQSDNQRWSLETQVYDTYFPAYRHALFVPVHVGGTPWLCFYILTRDFRHNYLLYRELVPKLADRVRVAARAAFLDHLASVLRDQVSSDELSDAQIERINSEWLKLSLVYPFPVCRLGWETGAGDPRTTFQFGRQAIRVRFVGHIPAFRPQVQYDDLTEAEVASHLQAEANAMRARVREALSEAVTVFATLTHEVRSLFRKHFLNLRYSLERNPTPDTIREALHAWDRIHAAVEIAYTFAKAHTSRDLQPDFTKGFRDPITKLYAQGTLCDALTFVAHRVHELECLRRQPQGLTVTLPGLSRGSSIDLSPEQFASCYMLVGEPLRNLVHHHVTPGASARWWIEQDVRQIEIVLEQSHSPEEGLPTSVTFQALGSLLEKYFEGSAAWMSKDAARNVIRWHVRLSASLLGGER